MFKFMKSKKGFTLVELMIVVVIMAILVVVAVPIYNSVTDNARAKTCIDNQRQIISNVGNMYMMAGNSGNGTATITFAYDAESKKYTMTCTGLAAFGTVTEDQIKGSFQTIPGCGDESNKIVATLSENTTGGTALISTQCQDSSNAATEHIITNLAETTAAN